ncbi:Glycosyl transferase family 2 [Paenibacillus sp. RU4T]|uniref:glycosyltransferase n=1 Tax=unclassified Paenibacillus TaxID=185978 RepID=UPI000954BA0C|nr:MULTISPECIES: glycosyltransferase [unclassified Paenibacillus]SIR56819.1 Glycosyl transferase family 2 [Paenibacillus sp. RU4X]SIR65447.1 Glycosyl transferase family 2 [Paenibacillus sp. RU4T]
MNIITIGYESGSIFQNINIDRIYTNIDYSLNSIVSATSPKTDLILNKHDYKNYSKSILLKNEINKTFLDSIEQLSSENDYLLIDLLDERYDLISINNTFLLDSWLLKDTHFKVENNFSFFKREDIDFDFWKNCADKFIEKAKINFGKNIILHEMYLSERILRNNKLETPKNISDIKKKNRLLRTCYEYIKGKLEYYQHIKIKEDNYTDFDEIETLNPAKKNKSYISRFIKELEMIRDEESKNKYDIAIIIVSYNVEEYINEAVLSVINQKNFSGSFQIIIVDDGSLDNTQKIVKSLSRKYSNITYKFIKNSGTPSIPRNIGLELADSEYILFLDGDDTLSENALNLLHLYATNYSADQVIGKMLSFKNNQFTDSSKVAAKYKERYEFEQSISDTKQIHITTHPILYHYPSACGKLFKSELIRNIKFEKIKYGEDRLFAVDASFKSKKTIFVNDFVYNYRTRQNLNNLSTTQEKSLKNITGLHTSILRIYDIIDLNRFRINNYEAYLLKIVKSNIADVILRINQIMEYPIEDRRGILLLLSNILNKKIDHSKKIIRVYTMINYVKLKLLSEGKIDELYYFVEYFEFNARRYDYDFDGNFIFKTKNENIYLEFIFGNSVQSIDVTEYLSKSNLVNEITDIRIDKNMMCIEGLAFHKNFSINSKNDINHEIVIYHTKTKKEYRLKAQYFFNNLLSTSNEKYGHGGYKFKFEFTEHMDDGHYKFSIETTFLNIKRKTDLIFNGKKVLYDFKNSYFKIKKLNCEIIPLYKKRALSIIYKKDINLLKRKIISNIRNKQYSLKQIKMNNGIDIKRKFKLGFAVLTEEFSKFLFRKKNIILIGEKNCNTANDTGYWFFKHCRDQGYPVHYVINKKSPDFKKVKGLGNVVDYYSLKHIILSMNAKFILSSDNVNILLPSNIKHLRRKPKRIFIQHGVILQSKVDEIYHYKKDYADYIISSNKIEKDILKNHFGFNESNILNFGLSRFDSLKDNNSNSFKRIMVSFTWRKNIKNVTDLKESRYLKSIIELLNNNEFLSVLKKYKFTIDLCLHPRTCDLLKTEINWKEQLSRSPLINIHSFNDIDIRAHIEDCCMLITDYSSISYDFIYLNKPVINYLFENNMPLNPNTLDEVIPGKPVQSITELVGEVKKIIFNDGKPVKKIDKSKYIENVNKTNCEMLYGFIKEG